MDIFSTQRTSTGTKRKSLFLSEVKFSYNCLAFSCYTASMKLLW